MARKRSAIPPSPKAKRYADGTYRIDVRWTRPDGELVRKTFTAPLARLADDKLQAWRSEVMDGMPTGPSATFAELAAEHEAAQERKGVRQTTLTNDEWALGHIVPHIGSVPVGELTADQVSQVLQRAETALSPGSAQRLRRLMRAIVQRAVRAGYVARNVVDDTETSGRDRHRPDLPPNGDVIAALDGMREREDPLWPILWTLGATGMRLGEARGLRIEDVDLDAGVVRVLGQADAGGKYALTKTETSRRTLPIGTRLRKALGASLEGEGRPQDAVYVFTRSGSAAPFAESTVRQAWREAQLMAWGRTRLRIHDLRHWVASVLLSRGVPLPDVSRQLGHASPATTAAMYSWALVDSHDRVLAALDESGLG